MTTSRKKYTGVVRRKLRKNLCCLNTVEANMVGINARIAPDPPLFSSGDLLAITAQAAKTEAALLERVTIH